MRPSLDQTCRPRVRQVHSPTASRRLLGGFVVVRKREVKLISRADVQLREYLAQVILDRSWADEQPRGDRAVREAVARELSDVRLLCGELVTRLRRAHAHGFAGGEQFPASALGERLRSDRGEPLVRASKLLARIHP